MISKFEYRVAKILHTHFIGSIEQTGISWLDGCIIRTYSGHVLKVFVLWFLFSWFKMQLLSTSFGSSSSCPWEAWLFSSHALRFRLKASPWDKGQYGAYSNTSHSNRCIRPLLSLLIVSPKSRSFEIRGTRCFILISSITWNYILWEFYHKEYWKNVEYVLYCVVLFVPKDDIKPTGHILYPSTVPLVSWPPITWEVILHEWPTTVGWWIRGCKQRISPVRILF